MDTRQKKKGKNIKFTEEDGTRYEHSKHHFVSLTVWKRDNHDHVATPPRGQLQVWRPAGTVLWHLGSTAPCGTATSEPSADACRASARGRVVKGQEGTDDPEQ